MAVGSPSFISVASIPKLKGKANYEEWRNAVQGFCEMNGLWRYMLGGIPKPKAPSPPVGKAEVDEKTKETYDAKLLSWLTVTDSLRGVIPVMLLQNLTPPKGLYNGTRLQLTHIGRFILEGQILGGERHGKKRMSTYIFMNITEEELPWIVSQKQFPICLCSAMTVNKSQGQSLDTFGVDLRSPAFIHARFTLLSRGSLVSQSCASGSSTTTNSLNSYCKGIEDQKTGKKITQYGIEQHRPEQHYSKQHYTEHYMEHLRA